MIFLYSISFAPHNLAILFYNGKFCLSSLVIFAGMIQVKNIGGKQQRYDLCVNVSNLLNFYWFKPPSILILTVPRRYFCCGSLLLLVLAVRIYTLVQLLCY